MENFRIISVEDTVWVVVTETGVPAYDYEFERLFACGHPYRIDGPIRAVARMGAAQDYEARYRELASLGIELVHTPDEYALTSELPNWYPRLADLTPRSVCFEAKPTAADVASMFRWPVFIKGERQTNRHNRDQALIESAEHFDRVMAEWSDHTILSWQRVVCREFVPLRQVGTQTPHLLPKSFEFRTFCWKGRCVGVGPYWISETYAASPEDHDAIVSLAEETARRIGVTFLVVDIAQTIDGRWIVIEINDGQDSGYAGVQRVAMWRRIIDAEAKQ